MLTYPTDTDRPVHRIVYQTDDVVVSACGGAFFLTREQVRAYPYLTLWRGKQSCPQCGEFDWPLDVVQMFLLR